MDQAGVGEASGLDLRAGHVVTALYEVMPLRPVMATPRPGERLWDIGGGSGSVAIEWLLSHPRCAAITRS